MKRDTQVRLIYTRYTLPPVLMLLMLATMFLPSYRYVMDGKLEDAVSPMTLLANSYNNTRLALFGTDKVAAESILFSRNVLITLIALVLISLVGIASAVYTCYAAMKYFRCTDKDAAEKAKILFSTICPNRIVLCVINTLSVAVALFPYLTPFFYDQAYGARVILTLTMPDTLIFACISVAAIITLSIISAPLEKRLGADLFKKRKPFEQEKEKREYIEKETEKEEKESSPISDAEREQNERIRRLLSKNKNGND